MRTVSVIFACTSIAALAAGCDPGSVEQGGDELDNFRARFLIRVLCDTDGNRVFAEHDVETVARLPTSFARKVMDAAAKLNALTDEEIRELEKNSAADSK